MSKLLIPENAKFIRYKGFVLNIGLLRDEGKAQAKDLEYYGIAVCAEPDARGFKPEFTARSTNRPMCREQLTMFIDMYRKNSKQRLGEVK